MLGHRTSTHVHAPACRVSLEITPDTTGMKLYSASGNLCGQLKFPTGGLTTGADGSVISSSGNAGCTTTVWPGLLK